MVHDSERSARMLWHVHIGKDGINLAAELAHRSLPFSGRMIHHGFAPRKPKLANSGSTGVIRRSPTKDGYGSDLSHCQ
jgi:hypothetical protein